MKKPKKLKILPAVLSVSLCLTSVGIPGSAVTAYAGEGDVLTLFGMDAEAGLEASAGTVPNAGLETGTDTDSGAGMELETGMDTETGAGEENAGSMDAEHSAGAAGGMQEDGAGTNSEAYVEENRNAADSSGNSYIELNENHAATGVSIRWYQDQGLAVAVNEDIGSRKTFAKEYAAYITAEKIPAVQIMGFTGIDQRAFENAVFLQSVYIDETAEKIGDAVFMGCTGLQSVTLPDSLLEIGAYAFYGCRLLELHVFPESLVRLKTGAFWNCACITPESLPAGLDRIEGFVFNGCEKLELKSLPAGITEIGTGAFADCRILDLPELPEGVCSIGASAFSGCSALSLTELPEKVTVIGESAFAGCSLLALERLPEGVREIGMSTFAECSHLVLKHLPEGISSLGMAAFRGCTSLNLQDLPAGLTEIGRHAFRGCTSLALGSLPENLKTVGGYAFEGCTLLALEQLPEKLSDIGEYAFSGCSGLMISAFPDSLKTVGEYAFWKSPGVVVSSPNNASVSPVKAVLAWYAVTCVTGTGSTDYDASAVIGTERYAGYYGDDISEYISRRDSVHPSVDGYEFAAYAVPDGNEKIILDLEDETMVYAVYTEKVRSTFTVALPAYIEMDGFQMDGGEDGTGTFTGKIDYQVAYRLNDGNSVLSVCLLNADNGGSMDDSFLQYGKEDPGVYKENGGMIRRDADSSVVAWMNGNVCSGKYQGDYGLEGKYGSAEYDSSTGMYEGNGTIALTSTFAIQDAGTYSGHATVCISCK